jgi:hypothetical protein
MADETREITVRIGTRLTDAEIRAIDPRDIGRLQAQPPKPDVEGQIFACSCFFVCPYCGCASVEASSTSTGYRYFMCRCCGAMFRA